MKKHLIIVLYYWLPPLVWVGVIWGLSFIPDLRIEELGFWDLVLRKTAHVLEYFVFTLLLARVGLRENWNRITRLSAIMFSLAAAFGAAAFDEYIQTHVPGRVGAVTDVLIDGIGILAAGAFLLRRTERKHAAAA